MLCFNQPGQIDRYVSLDGSDALRSALKEFFSESVIQRCLVYNWCNMAGKLSKHHSGEVLRLFARLRCVQALDAAEKILCELKASLVSHNVEA